MLLDISNVTIFVYAPYMYLTKTKPILYFPKLPDLDPTRTWVLSH